MSSTHHNQSRRPRLYHPLTFRMAYGIARLLPRKASIELVRALGKMYASCSPERVASVRSNLEHVQQEIEPSRIVANYMESLCDYVYFRHMTEKNITDVFSSIQGLSHIEAGLKSGNGVVLSTIHLGLWELGGILCALRGLPINVVTLEEDHDELTLLREIYRSRFNINTVRIGREAFSFISVIQALQRNEIVAMLVERPDPRTAIRIPFFGKPCAFSKAPAMLSHLTGAAVVPAYVVNDGKGRYLADACPPVYADRNQCRDTALLELTSQLASTFEKIISKYPDQWYNFIPLWEQEMEPQATYNSPRQKSLSPL